ncbi:MAG: hypothetical protein WBJ34_10335, partial [Syntrophomonadaceae bacterium]
KNDTKSSISKNHANYFLAGFPSWAMYEIEPSDTMGPPDNGPPHGITRPGSSIGQRATVS